MSRFLEILFPKKTIQHYYNKHYQYVLAVFRALDADIKYIDPIEKVCGNYGTWFRMYINGREVCIDFSNYYVIKPEVRAYLDRKIPVFKFHAVKNTVPFLAWAFDDWKKYDQNIEYNAQGYISCRQRHIGRIRNTRKTVANKLCNWYRNTQTKLLSQIEYFKDINNISLSIHVPGCRIDSLDRGQLQYMAFGACTISPILYSNIFHPHEHYVPCANSFHNLKEKVDYCLNNKSLCLEIGQRAKETFQQYGTPEQLWKQIQPYLS